MISKTIAISFIAASLTLGPATRASADAGDFVAGAIVGAIGNHIVNQNNRRATPKRTYRATRSVKKTYRPRLPATQEGRNIQTALNYFGFDAGGVDGQLGKRSREAISRYQAHMGYSATGQLSDYEREFLLTSHQRAMAGGAATNHLIAANPQGARGLLHRYRDQMAAVAAPMQQPTASTTVVVAPQTVQPAAPAGTTTTTVTETAAPAAAEAEGSASAVPLPNFAGATEARSLASHCNTVSLLTNTNGGFTTVEDMVDANFALNEQFCLARTYAIAQGEAVADAIDGFTATQMAEQCRKFGPVLREHVAALSLKPQADVVQDVSSFVLASGMAPDQLSTTAQVCLGIGYRTDDMSVALGSALLLVALGEPVYGELMGHHLAQGFGTTQRTDLALAWYRIGLDAADGSAAVFVPGQPERTELIRAASMQVSGASEGSIAQEPANQPVAAQALPVFSAD